MLQTLQKKLSQNVPSCPKMSQNAHFRRIVVRTDLFSDVIVPLSMPTSDCFCFFIHVSYEFMKPFTVFASLTESGKSLQARAILNRKQLFLDSVLALSLRMTSCLRFWSPPLPIIVFDRVLGRSDSTREIWNQSFLVECTRLYSSLCRSVCLSVGPKSLHFFVKSLHFFVLFNDF